MIVAESAGAVRALIPAVDIVAEAVRSFKLEPDMLGPLADRNCRHCYGTGEYGRRGKVIIPCRCVRKRVTRLCEARVMGRLADMKAGEGGPGKAAGPVPVSGQDLPGNRPLAAPIPDIQADSAPISPGPVFT